MPQGTMALAMGGRSQCNPEIDDKLKIRDTKDPQKSSCKTTICIEGKLRLA